MNLEIVAATQRHRTVMRNLYELYSHDFSPMIGNDVYR